MSPAGKDVRQIVTREAALFLVLLFVGFVLLPIAIWFVGAALFGDYGGNGYWDFFATLSGKIRSGDRVAWFLILSPYLGIMALRFMVWSYRRNALSSSPTAT